MKDGNDTMFSFTAYVNNSEFDNDDNPYGVLKMHQYTNMRDRFDTRGKRPGLIDIEIPMVPCPTEDLFFRNKNLKYYCPGFNESHWLHGGFSASMWSTMRLVLHSCDNSTAANLRRDLDDTKIHKRCASFEESAKWFENNIIGVEANSKIASISDEFSQDLSKPKKNRRMQQTDLVRN